MRGSALLTTVLESMATNIARRRPLSASSTSRCDIWPEASAGGGTTWVDKEARFEERERLLRATISRIVDFSNQ